MHIAINVELAFSNPAGMGRYARELLRGIFLTDKQHSYTLFHSQTYSWPPNGDFPVLPENFRVRTLPCSRKELLLSWFLYGGPNALSKWLGSHDVYHDLSDILLPVASKRKIASLHDVFAVTIPRSFAWHSRLLFAKSRRVLRNADAVLTVSQFSKQKIVELLGIRPDKVAVAYGGVSRVFQRVDDETRLRATPQKYGIGTDYFLFVGTINRRKNPVGLLRAFHLLRVRSRTCATQLVLCGKLGIGSEEFLREVLERGLTQNVRILHSVSDKELAELMSGCQAFVLPSLGEGFGLPVAEAMACGAPVICGNQCAMQEVAGEAAIAIDPTDIGQLAEAMERIVSDTQLAQSLRHRGVERAKQFTWRKTAERVLELYQHLM